MNILITGIGGPTPRSIAHRIRESYPSAKLIGADVNHKALGFYLHNLVDFRVSVPRATEETYWERIEKIIRDYSIDFAIIQPESEVKEWGNYFKKNQKFPCPTIIPPLEHTDSLMNKARMSDLLKETNFIPKTVTLHQSNADFSMVETQIGFPCWIRASVGSGGLGSLKINSLKELEAWLFIHKDVPEFTVSEFLAGRHLANQMLYIDGELIKNAGLHCAEYVMADIAPSKVTGNTSFGRFINEEKLLEFCEEVMEYICERTSTKAHGVYSFDLKENENGELKVTEINIRHMAYTGIMGLVGFDLVGDTIKYLTGQKDTIVRGRHEFDSDYIFLRDVDERPIVMREQDLIKKQNG